LEVKTKMEKYKIVIELESEKELSKEDLDEECIDCGEPLSMCKCKKGGDNPGKGW